jgi:hypothetical protein
MELVGVKTEANGGEQLAKCGPNCQNRPQSGSAQGEHFMRFKSGSAEAVL